MRIPRLIFLTSTLALAAPTAHGQGRGQTQPAASRQFEQGEQALQAADAARARGDTRAAQTHLSEATAAFERALQADATFVDAYTKYAFALFAAGQPAAALPHLEAGLRAVPESLELTFWLGNVLLAAGRADAGVPHLERVARAGDTFPEANLLLGNHFYRAGDFGRAEDHLARYVSTHPDDVNARGTLGNAYFRRERFREARAEFDAVNKASPGNPQVLVNLGNCHLQLGDAAAAVRVLEQARALDPERESVWFNLGQAHLQGGHWADATQWFERYAVRQPTSFNGRYFLGTALFEGGQLEAARGALEAARALKADVPIVHYKLARLALKGGRLDAADTHVAAASALAPDDPWVASLRGTLARARGHLDAALALHKRAVELAPQQGRLRAVLGVTLAAMGQLEAAEQAVEAGLRLALQDTAVTRDAVHVLTLRARGLLAGGDAPGAIVRMRRVVMLSDASTDALAGLATALVAAGQIDEALAALEGPLARAPDSPALRAAEARARLAAGQTAAAITAAERASARLPSPENTALLASALVAAGDTDGALKVLAPFLRAEGGAEAPAAVVQAAAWAHLRRAARALGATPPSAEPAGADLKAARASGDRLDPRGAALLDYLSWVVALRRGDTAEATSLAALFSGPQAARLDAMALPAGHLDALQAATHLLGRREDKAIALLEPGRLAKQRGSLEARLLRRAYERQAERAYAAGALVDAGRALASADAIGHDAYTEHNLLALSLRAGKVKATARGKIERRLRTLAAQVPEAWFNWAALVDAQGRTEEAERAWTRYAQSNGPHAAKARELAEARRAGGEAKP